MPDQFTHRGSRRRTLVDRVREALLADLFSNEYSAGDQLPNEGELAERFDCSRATIREAVRGLVDGGYLVRRHGTGTFVTAVPRHRHTLNANLSYTAMIREAGLEPGRRLVHKVTRPATDDEAEALQLPPQEPVLSIERIRTGDGVPVVFSVDRIPVAVLGGALDDVGDSSVYSLLDGLGTSVTEAMASLRPVVADKRLARMLDVPVGSPLLHIEQVDFDGAGRPVMLSAEWHVPDVFELCVSRRRDAPGL